MPCKQIKTSTHWCKKKKGKEGNITEQSVAKPHTNSDDFAVGLFVFRLTGVLFFTASIFIPLSGSFLVFFPFQSRGIW